MKFELFLLIFFILQRKITTLFQIFFVHGRTHSSSGLKQLYILDALDSPREDKRNGCMFYGFIIFHSHSRLHAASCSVIFQLQLHLRPKAPFFISSRSYISACQLAEMKKLGPAANILWRVQPISTIEFSRIIKI